VNKRAEGRKRSPLTAGSHREKCSRDRREGEAGGARFNAHLAEHFSIEINGRDGGYREVFDVAAAVQTAQLPI